MSLYIKGFNHGYILAKELPKVFVQYMSIGYNESEYGQGFGDGAMLGQGKRITKEIEERKKNRNRGGLER